MSTTNFKNRVAEFNTYDLTNLAASLAIYFSANGSTGLKFTNINSTNANITNVLTTNTISSNVIATNTTTTNLNATNITGGNIHIFQSIAGHIVTTSTNYNASNLDYAILFTGSSELTLFLPNPTTVPGITYKLFNNTTQPLILSTLSTGYINARFPLPYTLNITGEQITSDGSSSYWLT